MNYKLAGSAAAAASMALVLGAMVFRVGDTAEPAPAVLNTMIVLLGLALGWLFGILLSPYSAGEKREFSTFAKAFGVFASGYLAAKTDKVVEELLQPTFLLESLHGFRVMAFAVAVLIGLIATFVFRRYG